MGGGAGDSPYPPSKVYVIYFFWNRKRFFNEDKKLKEKKGQILEKYISFFKILVLIVVEDKLK